jgi:hypothetical protein
MRKKNNGTIVVGSDVFIAVDPMMQFRTGRENGQSHDEGRAPQRDQAADT